MTTEQVLNAHILNLYRLIGSGLENIPYSRHMSVLFKPGDILKPEPFKAYGGAYLKISQTRPASLLPFRQDNIAVKWTTPLNASNIDGSQSTLTKATEKFDVATGELAHWKLLVMTSGWEMEVGQPNENKLFVDRIDTRRLHFGNTTWNYLQGDYGAIPEIFTLEDRTPIKLVAYSLDIDRANYDVIYGLYGFKYYVEPITFEDYTDETKTHPQTKAVIRLGNPERGV
ncbi:MAG: hypothetical protein R3321_01125 [Nitrososphaeraceae archaeon]|nr:hypothetical protein [Nitrososphaeraceae archaeon]